MNWQDISKDVAKIAPALGAAVGGPAGAGIGSVIASLLGCANTPDAVQQALTIDPDAAVKIKSLETQVQLAQITAASDQVKSVNETLVADARGDSFWQKNHHAFESTFVVLMVAAIYVGLPMMGIAVPSIPESVFIMLGAILGVTAWQHGQVNQQIANGGK
jgi:hypothetical protein